MSFNKGYFEFLTETYSICRSTYLTLVLVPVVYLANLHFAAPCSQGVTSFGIRAEMNCMALTCPSQPPPPAIAEDGSSQTTVTTISTV